MTLSSTLGWFSRIITMTLELDGPMVDDAGEGDRGNCWLFYDELLKILMEEVPSSMTVEEIKLLREPFIATKMAPLRFCFSLSTTLEKRCDLFILCFFFKPGTSSNVELLESTAFWNYCETLLHKCSADFRSSPQTEFIVPWDSFTGRVALFDCKGQSSYW